LYNIYIFKFAGSHATEIIVAAALLYLVGFGLMCFNVREGEYPPPPEYVGGGKGVTGALRTFGKECFSLRHYWLVFLISMSMIAAQAASPFMLFFYQQTGLTLEQIGRINGFGNISLAVAVPLAGWLADRFHPLRIVIVGFGLQLFLAIPATLAWLIWSPGPEVSYWLWLTISVALAAPAGALIGLQDPTVFMRIFPRSRYGQFCSANAMLRSVSAIVTGILVGVFLDTIKNWKGERIAYFCLPLWNMFFFGLALFFLIHLFKSWNKLGGDLAYVPPLPEGSAKTAEVAVA
jgi:MFS family permease